MLRSRITVIVLLCVVSSIGIAAERPNFLLLLLDDAGWTDIECFGSQIETPHLNRLAQQGMRFTDCHSAAPNCSPSRAGLLTGRTPSRVGIYSYLPANHVMHLRTEEITVAELLKGVGYHTGHFGKWHLSQLLSEQPGPLDQGFDYSLGTDNNAVPSHLNPTNFVRNGETVGKTEGYSCQIVVDETLTWLEQIDAGNPETRFFACVWFHEPHTPIASPPELVEKYQKRFPNLSAKEATYHANIENVDSAIGRLLARVDELGIAEDTMVFFTSDNGPLNRFSRIGLRGQKSHLWEGGHRVPGVFRWPAKIPAGAECHVAVSGVDYLPTVCEVAGVQPPGDRVLDGESIWPLLRGDTADFQREKPLYWFFYRLNPAMAIRVGDWSLIANSNDSERPKSHGLVREDMPHIRASVPVDAQLFDLTSDLSQQHDLGSARAEVRKQLREMLEEMHREVVAEGHDWNIPTEYGAASNRRIWNSE